MFGRCADSAAVAAPANNRREQKTAVAPTTNRRRSSGNVECREKIKCPFLAGERARRARVRRLGRCEILGSATRLIYVRFSATATDFLQPRAYRPSLDFCPR